MENKDEYYDNDIIQFIYIDILRAGPFKTLNDLFNDLYDHNDNLIFNSEDKKEKVRKSLKETYTYNINNLEILQVDIRL